MKQGILGIKEKTHERKGKVREKNHIYYMQK